MTVTPDRQPSEAPDPPGGNQSPARSLARGTLRASRIVGIFLLRHAGQVGRFYWENRRGLRALLHDSFPSLPGGSDPSKDLRIEPEDRTGFARHGREGWTIELPDACCVCGEETDRPWIEDRRDVQRLTGPLWIPQGVLLISLVFAVCGGSWWWLLPGLLIGPAVGYWLRDGETVRIRFRRCEQHAETPLPRLRLFDRAVIVRVGRRQVVQQFREPWQPRPGEIPVPPPFDEPATSSAAAPVPPGLAGALSGSDQDSLDEPIAPAKGSSAYAVTESIPVIDLMAEPTEPTEIRHNDALPLPISMPASKYDAARAQRSTLFESSGSDAPLPSLSAESRPGAGIPSSLYDEPSPPKSSPPAPLSFSTSGMHRIEPGDGTSIPLPSPDVRANPSPPANVRRNCPACGRSDVDASLGCPRCGWGRRDESGGTAPSRTSILAAIVAPGPVLGGALRLTVWSLLAAGLAMVMCVATLIAARSVQSWWFPDLAASTRWWITLGCLVGPAAVVGMLHLDFLVGSYLEACAAEARTNPRMCAVGMLPCVRRLGIALLGTLATTAIAWAGPAWIARDLYARRESRMPPGVRESIDWVTAIDWGGLRPDPRAILALPQPPAPLIVAVGILSAFPVCFLMLSLAAATGSDVSGPWRVLRWMWRCRFDALLLATAAVAGVTLYGAGLVAVVRSPWGNLLLDQWIDLDKAAGLSLPTTGELLAALGERSREATAVVALVALVHATSLSLHVAAGRVLGRNRRRIP